MLNQFKFFIIPQHYKDSFFLVNDQLASCIEKHLFWNDFQINICIKTNLIPLVTSFPVNFQLWLINKFPDGNVCGIIISIRIFDKYVKAFNKRLDWLQNRKTCSFILKQKSLKHSLYSSRCLNADTEVTTHRCYSILFSGLYGAWILWLKKNEVVRFLTVVERHHFFPGFSLFPSHLKKWWCWTLDRNRTTFRQKSYCKTFPKTLQQVSSRIMRVRGYFTFESRWGL